MVILIRGIFSDYDYIITVIFPRTGRKSENFTYPAFQPVSDNTVSNLLADRDAYSASVILALFQKYHDEKPVSVRSALPVDLAKIPVFFQRFKFLHVPHPRSLKQLYLSGPTDIKIGRERRPIR